jgi:hypothetical protein
MRQQSTLIFALGLSVLSAGCVGTGPNTQQGAVTGATLGAIAGGIIGNNSGRQTWEGAALGALAGAIAGGTIGNSVDHQNGTLYGPPQPAAANMVVRQMPTMPPRPAMAEAVTPPPSSSAVWIPGYWAYDGYRYAWVAGHWEIPPPNSRTYVAPYWVYQGGAYTYLPGSWR